MGTMRDKAQALLDGRLTALDTLETAQRELDHARANLLESEKAYAAAWEGATTAGWTPAELRGLDVHEPTAGRRPGRPKGARTTRTPRRKNTTPAAENQAPATVTDGADNPA